MARGVTLYNFTRTRFGTLSDLDMQKPGNYLVYVVGMAQGSNVWEKVTVSDDFAYQYPNPRWAGISTSFFATQLLLIPMQSRAVCRGKMVLDFSPKVTPSWLGSFLDTWYRFIQLNPQVLFCYFSRNLLFYIFSSKFRICIFLLILYITVLLVYPLQVMHFLVLLVYLLFCLPIVCVFLLLLEKSLCWVSCQILQKVIFNFCHFLILLLAVRRYLTQSFTKHGKLMFCNDDPTLDVNRFIGQLLLLIWELCDVYNLMKIPHNPFWPTDITPWTLADFNVPNKVSLFSGTRPSTFPYFSL